MYHASLDHLHHVSNSRLCSFCNGAHVLHDIKPALSCFFARLLMTIVPGQRTLDYVSHLRPQALLPAARGARQGSSVASVVEACHGGFSATALLMPLIKAVTSRVKHSSSEAYALMQYCWHH
jgi:hypothetical protein